MSLSGVKFEKAVREVYDQVKMKQKGQTKLRYVIFGLNAAKTAIDQLEICEQDSSQGISTFNKLVEDLPDKLARFIVYDFDYISKEGHPKNDLLMISWVPDIATIKEKMINSSTAMGLKTHLSHNTNYYEAQSKDMLEPDEIIKVLPAGSKLRQEDS